MCICSDCKKSEPARVSCDECNKPIQVCLNNRVNAIVVQQQFQSFASDISFFCGYECLVKFFTDVMEGVKDGREREKAITMLFRKGDVTK